jgi:hypothetical protein
MDGQLLVLVRLVLVLVLVLVRRAACGVRDEWQALARAG